MTGSFGEGRGAVLAAHHFGFCTSVTAFPYSCCISIEAKISFLFQRESLEENIEILRTLCG